MSWGFLLASCSLHTVSGMGILAGLGVAVGGGIVLWVLLGVAGTPRVRAFIWHHSFGIAERLGVPDPQALPAPPIEVWLDEVHQFGRDGVAFWELLRGEYEQYGMLNGPAERSGLDRLVRGAFWPDEEGDDEEAPSDMVPRDYAAICLREFITRAYREVIADQDDPMRSLRDTMQKWSIRAGTDGGFRGWLGRTLEHETIDTAKLLWYVEEARCRALKDDNPDYSVYAFLRDVLATSSPSLLEAPQPPPSSTPDL